MVLRKVRDEAEARAVVAAANASGLPRRVWAREHGISPRSLNAWQMNLDRRDRRRAPGLQLVEVTGLTAPRPTALYVIEVAGVRVELGDDFRDDTLGRLVRVLRGC